MMPIIGDKSRFAAWYELAEDSQGVWMLGRCCFWCGGHKVGEDARNTSLRDVLFGVEGLLKHAGRRSNPRFVGMAAAEVSRELSLGLFGEGGREFDAVAIEEEWARHIASPSVDVFDAWSAFLVEEGEHGRLITSRTGEEAVVETLLRAGEFDEVLRSVQKALDVVYASSARAADGA